MLTLESLQRCLGGKISNGQLRCPGPGHSAADESLSIKLDPNAPDGFVAHSFADDDPIVCRDYIREKCSQAPWKPNGNGRARRSEDEVEAALATAIKRQSADSKSRVVCAYPYSDEGGTLLYEVVRLEPKSFRQRRPDGNGGWIWKLEGVRRVIYRWPEILRYADATIFVCEGEKDADRVASLGHCATTVAGGKWTEDCVKALANRDVMILEDADEAGRKKALAAATALHGTAATIRIVRLPDLTGHPNNKDVSDCLDADPRRAEKLIDICFSVPLWTPDNSEPNAGPETKNDDSAIDAAASKAPALPFINIVAWHEGEVPKREWTVENRIPAHTVTLLSGDGGVGKTILALHLSVAIVLGCDWIGTLPEPGPVLAICCDDEEPELHRRLARIVQHCGGSFADLAALHLISLAGESALLATPAHNGLIAPTKLLQRVSEAACDLKPKLLLLDNTADVYGGNENDRAQVRQFIGLLRSIAMASGAGVLLTSHPSLTGLSSGSGLSGSTAWNASVRSRLYFKRAIIDNDEEPDPDLRVLEVVKANYGPVGETIMLRWDNGLFLPVAGQSTLEKLAREQKVDNLFLMLLNRWTKQGRAVSDKAKANAYAPGAFAIEPEAKADNVTKQELAAAMDRLFRAGRIHSTAYGPPSRGWTKLEQK